MKLYGINRFFSFLFYNPFDEYSRIRGTSYQLSCIFLSMQTGHVDGIQRET